MKLQQMCSRVVVCVQIDSTAVLLQGRTCAPPGADLLEADVPRVKQQTANHTPFGFEVSNLNLRLQGSNTPRVESERLFRVVAVCTPADRDRPRLPPCIHLAPWSTYTSKPGLVCMRTTRSNGNNTASARQIAFPNRPTNHKPFTRRSEHSLSICHMYLDA